MLARILHWTNISCPLSRGQILQLCRGLDRCQWWCWRFICGNTCDNVSEGRRRCCLSYSSEQLYLKSITKQTAGSIVEVLCMFIFRLAVEGCRYHVVWVKQDKIKYSFSGQDGLEIVFWLELMHWKNEFIREDSLDGPSSSWECCWAIFLSERSWAKAACPVQSPSMESLTLATKYTHGVA